jgi:hypothetical protein
MALVPPPATAIMLKKKGICLGTTAKYLRRSKNGAVGNGLCLTT